MRNGFSYFYFLPKLLGRIGRNPRIILEVLRYFYNDILSGIGVYEYEFPILFIAGLPKSGTTWLLTQLGKIPGYNIRPIYDPGKVTKQHNISDSVFSWLPRCGHSVVRLHTRYTPDNFRIITSYVPKFVVTVRDLRDVCVSSYLHIKLVPTHPHSKLYGEMEPSAGIRHRANIILDEYVSWINEWLTCAEQHPNVIKIVRYEDLITSPEQSYSDILKFYGVTPNPMLLKQFAQSRLREEKDLKKELRSSVGLGTSSTARKGQINQWSEYFSTELTEYFELHAGSVLRRLGYDVAGHSKKE